MCIIDNKISILGNTPSSSMKGCAVCNEQHFCLSEQTLKAEQKRRKETDKKTELKRKRVMRRNA